MKKNYPCFTGIEKENVDCSHREGVANKGQTSSLIWKLKEQLDQSYEEEKSVTHSHNSHTNTLSLRFPSSISEQHSTSIMNPKSTPQATSTMLDFLRDRDTLQQHQQHQQHKLTAQRRTQKEQPPSVSFDWRKVQKLRYRSQQKDRIAELRRQRSKILNDIHSQLERESATKQAQLDGFSSLMQSRQTVLTNSRNTVRNMSGRSARSASLGQNSQLVPPGDVKSRKSPIVQSACSVNSVEADHVTVEPPRQPKMMKNILSMKNQLKAARQSQGSPKEQLAQWYQLPEPQDLAQLECESLQLPPSQFNAMSFNNYSSCSQGTEPSLSRVIECLQTNGFLTESKPELVFTFGQLNKTAAEMMIQRHAKKVSIELEQSDVSERYHHRMYS